MSDKDKIKELFSNELKNLTSNVDPSLWNGIASGIGTSAGVGGSILSNLSIAAKSMIIVSAVVIAGVTTVLVTSTSDVRSNDPENEPAKEEVVLHSTDEPTDTESTIGSSSQEIEENTNLLESFKSSNTTADNVQYEKQESTEKQKIVDIQKQDNISSDVGSYDVVDVISSIDREENVDLPIKKSKHQGDSQSNEVISTTIDNQEEKEEEIIPLSIDLQVEKLSNQHYVFRVESSLDADIWVDLGNNQIKRGNIIEYIFEQPGEYIITAIAEKDGLEVFDEHTLKIEVEGKITQLPNVFSPDGDGVNDLFFIGHEGIADFQLTIFNKKSEVVFETNNPDFKWDGLHMKTLQKVDPGNYFYIIVANDELGNSINKYEQVSIYY